MYNPFLHCKDWYKLSHKNLSSEQHIALSSSRFASKNVKREITNEIKICQQLFCRRIEKFLSCCLIYLSFLRRKFQEWNFKRVLNVYTCLIWKADIDNWLSVQSDHLISSWFAIDSINLNRLFFMISGKKRLRLASFVLWLVSSTTVEIIFPLSFCSVNFD